jgi:hypothetical protein
MIQELTAQAFLRVMKGGRTEPLLVTANTARGIEPFVVKLFRTEEIKKRNSVQNEVLGNVLAKEFGLSVPEPALIEFNSDFLKTLPFDQLTRVTSMDSRIKFATRQCEGVPQYITGLRSDYIQKKISPDTLFAFDTLIRNADRTNGKPNLLMGTDTAFVIDHELGFQSIDRAIHELRTNNWTMRYSQFHIFYPLLKRKQTKAKAGYFGEFEEYLKYLNVNKLDPYLQQLQGHSYQTSNAIKDWLTFAKGNLNSFINILRGALR